MSSHYFRKMRFWNRVCLTAFMFFMMGLGLYLMLEGWLIGSMLPAGSVIIAMLLWDYPVDYPSVFK